MKKRHSIYFYLDFNPTGRAKNNNHHNIKRITSAVAMLFESTKCKAKSFSDKSGIKQIASFKCD